MKQLKSMVSRSQRILTKLQFLTNQNAYWPKTKSKNLKKISETMMMQANKNLKSV